MLLEDKQEQGYGTGEDMVVSVDVSIGLKPEILQHVDVKMELMNSS